MKNWVATILFAVVIFVIINAVSRFSTTGVIAGIITAAGIIFWRAFGRKISSVLGPIFFGIMKR